jgi:predicted nucleic acid-binding protein
MVVIDATMLLLMLRPGTPVPAGPRGVPVDRAKDRVDYLVQRLDRQKTKIIIPTPALAESLVRAGAEASQQIIEHLQKYSVFRIEPFDTRAALEVAAMARADLSGGRKRDVLAATATTYAKVKYDRQIMATARVNSVTAIYTDDKDIRSMAEGTNIDVIGVADLPLPPEKMQQELELTGMHEGSVRPSGDESEQGSPP